MNNSKQNYQQGTAKVADEPLLARRYCILGFEYNEPMKHAEFFEKIIDSWQLKTTDDWDNVKFYQTLEEAETMRLQLRDEFNDYGWYIVICNAR